jgi:hypothetical protein
MKLIGQLLKFAAVLSSFSLMGCIVYDHAGGDLLGGFGRRAKPDHESLGLPGSDAKMSQDPDDDRKPVLLPGSKSFPQGFQTF